MKDKGKTKQQLLAENAELRRRIQELETCPKRVEKELATSRAILQAAIDSLPFDLGALSLDGRYMLQNAAGRANWGDSIGKRPEEICTNKDDLAVWQDNHRRALAGEKLEGDVEITIRGEKRCCHHVTVPIWDDGCIQGVVGVNIDITEAKRAQEALKKAHDQLEQRVQERTAELSAANDQLRIFRRFAEASNQGFAMADLEGFITYLNPALCRMAGVAKPQDALGKHLSEYCPKGALRERETGALPALVLEGHWEGELVGSPAGTTTYILQSSFLIEDEAGNPSHLAAVITDITERKQTEAALRQSHDELRTIYDGMVDGLHILNLATLRPVRANSALCRMMGYSEEELLSLSPDDVHPPEELPRIRRDFQAFLEGRILGASDVPLVRKDGSVFYADITASRIVYKGLSCLMCFFRDTTERRKAQQALERERQSLWRMLQASDHERQIISYEIHDGLAQDLAAAWMQLEAYEAFRENSPDKARKAHKTAMELVHLAHSEARRLISDVRPPVIDENGLEAAVSHLVHEQRQRGGAKIDFRSHVQFRRLPAILENSLYRIAQEALANACKHSRSKEVKVVLAQESQDVRLEVQDRGIGFDPQSVEKGHFGLEGIRQRVRLLGGRLTIESAPGCGTLVQVVVPILEKQRV